MSARPSSSRSQEAVAPSTSVPWLDQPVEALRGVGPKTAHLLRKKGYHTIRDIAWLLPFRYEDRRVFHPIRSMEPGRKVQGIGRVRMTTLRYLPTSGRWLDEAIVQDGTGEISLKWFRGQRKRRPLYRTGDRVLFAGTIVEYQGRREIFHPDVEMVPEKGTAPARFGKILPVYPAIDGIPGPTLRRIIRAALDGIEGMPDPLPLRSRIHHGLPSLSEALRQIHSPDQVEDISGLATTQYLPFRRLVFDEFLAMQLALRLRRTHSRERGAAAFPVDRTIVAKWKAQLPFHLTLEQEETLEVLCKDLEKPYPMNRLLHGEVGSGKTIVALLASAIVAFHDQQTVFLLPTELLCFQLERVVKELDGVLPLRPACLTGSITGRNRKALLRTIEQGDANLVIGTHAVLQKEVVFSGVGLVVVDEQHRFGVIQKATLRNKAQWPHMLVMSATPIPRTLALTMYGDIDVSTLRHAVQGRNHVSTRLIADEERPLVYDAVRRGIEGGARVYWVAPRIDSCDGEGMKNVEELYAELTGKVFPTVPIARLHGGMPSDHKREVMDGFRNGTYRILVATTVVELGIDAPEAAFMVVEHPERYGLAQLHQLRGRIGRGSRPGQCFLIVNRRLTPLARTRLELFCSTLDGFRLAEEDLSLRGPGEFMGTRQTGLPGFRIADCYSHYDVLVQASQEAARILHEDPWLLSPEHNDLAGILGEHIGQRLPLSQVM